MELSALKRSERIIKTSHRGAINKLLRPLDSIPIAGDVQRNFSRSYTRAASGGWKYG